MTTLIGYSHPPGVEETQHLSVLQKATGEFTCLQQKWKELE